MNVAQWAPYIFVLLWSTGFIGAKFGLPYAQPFTFLALRMLIVVVLMGLYGLVARVRWPQGIALNWHIAVSGLLLHTGYLGGIFFAISRGMPSGLAALVVGLQPILTALLAHRWLGERANRGQWLGLGLGFLGVALVVGEKVLNARIAHIEPEAFVAIVFSLLSTTFGTLYQKRYASQMPLVGGTVVQYIAALVGFSVLVLVFGESLRIRWTADFVFALAWLVVVLSMGAVLLLMYLIRHSSASRVASLFYLVPPATALEAYFLFGEHLGVLALLGMLLTAIGVALVVRR